jgi:hypothetical protein
MTPNTTMTEPTIICPNCKTEIRLTESLAAPLLEATRKRFEVQIAEKDADVARREAAVREQQAKLAKDRDEIDQAVAARLDAARTTIAAEEAKKARLLAATDLQEKAKEIESLNEVLRERDAKLAEAQKVQADLMRKERELEDAKREVDLSIEKGVQARLETVRDKAKKDAEEGLQLKVREKEEQISSMQRQIEDLKRKAEQGSQQLQGEAQELELEAILRERFPRDSIEPVAKGEFGGDLLHRVVGRANQPCGTILWEIKRTRNWSDGWLAKVRDDQRTAKAEVALIVSHALPKGMDSSFDYLEPRTAIPVAVALRESLIALAVSRQAGEGQLTKMEMVYQYLTGPRFRHRVEAIVEKFSDMQDDLDRERKMMTRQWAKREQQIRGVIESTAGMYGDLQGIAGRTLQEIEGLDVQFLEGPESIAEEIEAD